MKYSPLTAFGAAILAGVTVGLSGCYESTGVDTPQAQTQPPEQPGPLTSMASGQGAGNSALGGAKRVAGNIAAQAEDASKKTAEQADRQMEEH